VDSAVLLDLLVRDSKREPRTVSAVHVHHGLSPNADRWAQACERFCAERGVALDVVRVNVDRRAKAGLEAAAREARYAVYAKRHEPFVALAHHLDDQAETVLLQLLRGTGLKGVAAMPPMRPLAGSKVTIYRPLIALSRDAIMEYARGARLTWVDDESNASVVHDRNYLRHEIAPRLEGRFPGWRESFGRFARHASEADGLLAAQAALDGAGNRGTLTLSAGLPAARRANALRNFLAAQALAMPTERRLAEMARQLYDARDDARVRVEHDGAIITRHRGAALVERLAARAGDSWRVEWHGEKRLDLGEGRGHVQFTSAKGTGIDATLIDEGEWSFMPRRGGEKIRISTKGRTRTLKNLLQEHSVPALRRDHLPLLFRGSELVWVPGVGIATQFACGPRAQGLLPRWAVAGESAL
jgi:tRNA(Ile)-lysidine synthase